MANQVSAKMMGDEYQHTYAFLYVLDLKYSNRKVTVVRVEDEDAASMDDVTLQHEATSDLPDRYFQVKYHVDQRDSYSTDKFLEQDKGKSSLLQKFWKSWKSLSSRGNQRKIELYLVSNWSWSDNIKKCISGRDYSLKDEFFTSTLGSDIGKLRKRWIDHLGVTEAEFELFARCLRLKVGYSCWKEVQQTVREKMEHLSLKSDETSQLVIVGIVREWIESGTKDITLPILENAITKHDLYLPPNAERSINVHLMSISDQAFDIAPDHIVDLRPYFYGSPHKRGHQLKDPADWNNVLLPKLGDLGARLRTESDCRLIRARGYARLSPWLAFGHTFPEVSGYTIEIDQQGLWWRTDAEPSPDFELVVTSAGNDPQGEVVDGEGQTIALGISVAAPIDDEVREYLEHRSEKIAALLLTRPERDLGKGCLRDAGDATALAQMVKSTARSYVQRWRATRLLLFYAGPIGGACFIGHRLNAVCREIQIMEHQHPGYSPSFLLD